MRSLILHRQRHRKKNAGQHLLKAPILRLDEEWQMGILDADALDGNAACIRLILYVLHQISLVSYAIGSSTPASAKPRRRSLQLSQTPQAFSPPL